MQGGLRIGKNAHFFKNWTKAVFNAKKSKITTTKSKPYTSKHFLNIKVTCYKPCFESAYLEENVKKNAWA